MCQLVKGGEFGAKSMGATGEKLQEVVKTEGTVGEILACSGGNSEI